MALLKTLGRSCRPGHAASSLGRGQPWRAPVRGQPAPPCTIGLASGGATGTSAARRTQGQLRQMATLRELSLRLKSVQNISKITKSMKMIAATKLTRAQRNMEVAREYGKASSKIFELSQTAEPAEGKKLVVTVSSDRGLCGGIHSTVSKATKRLVASNPDLGVVILGDKAKSQLQRELRAKIMLTFNQIGKSIPTFTEAAAIADAIRQHVNSSYASVAIVYNSFKSVIAFEAKTITAFSAGALRSGAKFSSYESSSDTLADFQNFTLANALYWAMSEGHASEMASKRTAMENATKNAGEMIQQMTMQYNRSRQAVITNELIDIITGASAL